MKILQYPDPLLRRNVALVSEITDEIRRTVLDMFPTMYAAKGVGLAASQVALDASLFVISLTGLPEDELVCINPEITASEGDLHEPEGCLSLPGLEARVHRFRHVRLHALDLQGEPFDLEASDLLARVIQHEVDHLAGLLFIDKLGPAARISLKSRLKEMEERPRRPGPSSRTPISGPELG